MSHANFRRRLPALLASTALVASLLPLSATSAQAATAKARTTEDGCPSNRVPDAKFPDAKDHFLEREINCIAWYDITKGNAEGEYGISDPVRRGPMAAFLVRIIESTGRILDPSPPQAFDDVAGNLFAKPINQLAALGVVGGTKDKDDFDKDGDREELIYQPNNTVSRGQMATFLNATHAAITGVSISSADDFFNDDNGHPHEGSINAVASVGLATGNSDTTFNPNGKVNRAQMAAFIARELDFLVELGELVPPVQGAADVVLDEVKVNQGRQVIGRILTEDNVPVKSATVDICGGDFGKGVSINEDNFAFAFTLPFQAPVGPCDLAFNITLGNNRAETENHVIEVLETTKVLLGPELVSMQIVTVGPDQVTIRYEFNATTPLNQAVEPSKFRLYGFAGQQFAATSATRIGDFSVEATFPTNQYEDSTTGGIAQFAVQDQDGYQVAEYAFGLRDVRLNAGETEFPDLLTATVANNTSVTFEFDAPALGVEATDFEAVFVSNGVATTATGSGITNGGSGSNTVTVTFNAPESGGVIHRGVVKKNSIQAITDGPAANARQSADITGPSQHTSPHLTSLILDQANNQVQFVFSEAVVNNAANARTCGLDCQATGGSATPGRGVEIYDISGKTFRTTDVVAGSNNTLIATFAQGDVTGLIQGGSADAGVAKAARNETLLNGIDEVGRENVFKAGQTASPDLLKVNKVTDADGALRVTYTFDQTVQISTSEPIGQFLLYSQDNTRRALDLGDCDSEGVAVTCILADGSDEFLFASGAVYASVSYAAVNAGNNAKFNPEGGFRLR